MLFLEMLLAVLTICVFVQYEMELVLKQMFKKQIVRSKACKLSGVIEGLLRKKNDIAKNNGTYENIYKKNKAIYKQTKDMFSVAFPALEYTSSMYVMALAFRLRPITVVTNVEENLNKHSLFVHQLFMSMIYQCRFYGEVSEETADLYKKAIDDFSNVVGEWTQSTI